MNGFNFAGFDILKQFPHSLEQWWKSSLDISKHTSSDIINRISLFSRAFMEFSVSYIEIMKEGVNMSSAWWIVPIATLCFAALPLYFNRQKSQKRLKDLTANIPGPVSFPVLGNVPNFAGCNLTQFFQKLTKLVQKYGPVVRFWMGNKLYIVLCDSGSIENIFGNKTLVKKNVSLSKIANGNGVVAHDDDEKWKIHRRIISSAFNSNVLEQFLDTFSKNSLMLSDKLNKVADGPMFDICSHISSCALDIICETIMGTNVNNVMEDDPEYKSKLLQALEFLGQSLKKPWMINEWINSKQKDQEREKEAALKLLHDFIDKVLAEKLESRRNGFQHKSRRQQVEYVQWVRGREMSLLDLMIQDQQMTLEEIKDEILSLIVSGTSLTAISCSYVLSLLGAHQNIQNKVLEEQERVFGPDTERSPSTSDLNSMKYLDQVLKETLRLYPPVPFLFRNIEEDTKLENGYILPRGSYAVIFSYLTHRNPEYFPNPERFDPERFSSDFGPEKNPYTYLPFGGGRRICVAYKYGIMEVKTILSTVLRRYHVSQTAGGVEELERNLQAGLVLKPANGFNIQITSRPKKVIPSIFREE